VALDANTGSYIWHYQENPRGDRDFDSNMPIVLADLNVNGAPRKVILHAFKNGFFYVIDRSNGKVLSAEKITKVTWAERVDLKRGRPVERLEEKEIWPSYLGAHAWQSMAFNLSTGLVYFPTMRLGMGFSE
jgi:quinohemoprotein ethanol dehydrogenase